MMEMYADPLSRGGVLEPSGTVEIKFRERDLLRVMTRLDPTYAGLTDELANLIKSKKEQGVNVDKDADVKAVRAKIDAREQQLYPSYHQAAEQFADLHDTSGRMKAKDVIRDVLHWKSARTFFFWRLRRRLLEERLVASLRAADAEMSRQGALDLVKSWSASAVADWNDNEAAANWLLQRSADLEQKVAQHTRSVQLRSVAALMKQLMPASASNGSALGDLVSSLDPAVRDSLFAALSKK